MNDIKLHPKNVIFHSLDDQIQDISLNPIQFTVDEKELDMGRIKQEIQSVTVVGLNKGNEDALF